MHIHSASLATSSGFSLLTLLLVRSVGGCCQLGSPDSDSDMVYGDTRCLLEINTCEGKRGKQDWAEGAVGL